MLIVKAAGRCCSWEPTADFYDEINIGPPAACLTPAWASLPRSARPNALVTKFNLRTHEKMSKGFLLGCFYLLRGEGERKAKLSTYTKKNLLHIEIVNARGQHGPGPGLSVGSCLFRIFHSWETGMLARMTKARVNMAAGSGSQGRSRR